VSKVSVHQDQAPKHIISPEIARSIASLTKESGKEVESTFIIDDALLLCFGSVSSNRQTFEQESKVDVKTGAAPKRVISGRIAHAIACLNGNSLNKVKMPCINDDALMTCLNVASSNRQKFETLPGEVSAQQHHAPKLVISAKIADLTARLQADTKSIFAADSGVDLSS
jgi:hypothetical protein